ncbi:IclR family transcriptional regulator [Nesterenkonia muleiensis]|uniref:IclR family transcriptional regulator n=1 Tax=Nesterenkonia muleiensis TaxID=2282648 RepID=UPI000E766E52|nr:IclR family transcriptional regulator C-terminal domain-containing protein [Nesterenkonia muleiensis]
MSGDSQRVLRNATQVVETLADSGALTVAEIAEQLHAPRTTIHRLVEGLSNGGYIDQWPGGQFALSGQWLGLADAARKNLPRGDRLDPVLTSIVKRTQLTAFVSVPHRGEMLCVEWLPGSGIDLLNYRPGSILPLRRGAAGRVLAAYEAGAYELEQDQELQAIRARGYAISEGDVTPGIAAVGVPIFAPRGSVYGALSVGGLEGDIIGRIAELADVLVEETARLH